MFPSWGVASFSAPGVNWNPVAEGGFHPHGLGALSDFSSAGALGDG